MFFESVAHAMGAAPGADGAAGAGGGIQAMIPLILMFVIFYFLLIRPQQKKAKQHKELLAGLKKGDNIITNGGIYGRIVSVNGDVISIDLGNNVVVKINRGFVSNIAQDGPKIEGKTKDKEKDKDNG